MWNWFEKLAQLNADGIRAVVVTVIESTGSTPRNAGAKMVVCADAFYGTIGGGHLEMLAIEDARKVLSEEKSKKIRYPLGAKTGQCCGGAVELFFEPFSTGPELYLFGAGHVAQALARTLIGTPFRVHVIDPRPEWIGHSLLPAEVKRHDCRWDEFVSDAVWSSANTYVAVMTHEHAMDQDIIADVVKRSARYIGLIGSRSKWERFKQRYDVRGTESALFEKVHCPIGVPVGGKAPQEIAISVAAALLKEHYGQ